ncbi:MAG TPA: hypothetical protein PKW33_15850 [Anaerolineaceae bacterium]|nr:hypothetical protein [Anaerolineaceae bacterium]HPN53070.1 hypothetical protein [Anaerolineaceae bacterium]
MNLIRLYYQLVRADLLERTRRYSFLVSLLLVIYLGYTVYAGWMVVVASGARGLLNSAWSGAQMAVVTNTFLGLIGFYLVKNCIERDEQTGVGQIIATTPMSSQQYLLGKWISNLAVLCLMVFILFLAAVVMQLFQQEAPQVDLVALGLPFLLLSVPLMSLTAGMAVLFETIRWLKGVFGNIVYFMFWVWMMIFSIETVGKVLPAYDPFGISIILGSITPSVKAVAANYSPNSFSIGPALPGEITGVFTWNGVDWTPDLLLGRLVLFLLPLLLVLLASLIFSRFDPARLPLLKGRKPDAANGETPAAPVQAAQSSPHYFGRGQAGGFDANVLNLVWQNMRLLVKGLPWWGYALGGLAWMGGFSSLSEEGRFWMAVTSLFPLFFLAGCGSRERRHNTGGMVFCGARPLLRLLLAEWLAAVLLTGLFFSSTMLGFIAAGEWSGAAGLGAAALLIPAAALAAGEWSGTSRVFEVVYLLAWYIGVANAAPELDFMGVTARAVVRQAPALLAGLAWGLVLLALLGRKRQV